MDKTPQNHKEHLATVPPEFIKRKMEFFRKPNISLEALPFICNSFVVRSPFKDFSKWVHPLDVVSIFDLKNWFGVPNEIAKSASRTTQVVNAAGKIWSGTKHFLPNALPQKKGWEFRSLDTPQRLAVQEISNNLLYGYVSPESLKTPAIEGIVDYMLTSAKKLKVNLFAGPDLIVCPDTTVEFVNIPVLYFNNILIYGNGRIKTPSTTKIHAYQIKRVP